MDRVTILFALVLFATPALADVPPPPGYVEQCTVEKQQGTGETCKECSAWHGDRDKCGKELGKDGYTRRCKTRGASAWREVWCKPGASKKDGGAKSSVSAIEQPMSRPAPPPWMGVSLGSLAVLVSVAVTWRLSRKS